MERVWIRGTSGSGKTTLARELAARLGAPMIDLDDLYWLPEWTPRPRDEFAALVEETIAGTQWVLAGNYTKIQASIEARADTLVWLDYPLPVTFGRVLRRTIGRCVTGEPYCGGNRERLGKALFSKRSILLWCLQTHAARHRDCLVSVAVIDPEGPTRVRHASPRETREWLDRRAPKR